jgi:hypothetical protein
MDKENKKKFILYGLRKSLVFSLIAAVILGILALIYSLVWAKPVLKSIAYGFYYGGAFALIFSIPLLYKRNEDPKIRKVRSESTLPGYGNLFKNPYTEKAMLESFKEFRGEGFWSGIFIVVFSLLLFFYGFIMENIYYGFRG